MITKGSICQKVLTDTKVYVLHNRTSSYVRQDWTDGREKWTEAQGACVRAGQHTDTGPQASSPGCVLHRPPTDQEQNPSPPETRVPDAIR